MANELSKLFITIGAKTSDFQKEMQNVTKGMMVAGGIMTGVGLAITGTLAMTVKAATQEEAGIARLSTALGNMGIQYDEVRGSLEKWIDTQQQKTAFADDAQRESLSALITVTGNLTKAQNLLTTAMDLARWKNIDLQTATDILARVYAGNMGTLSRYGIILKEGATATEALAEIQRLAAGQAEAYGKTTAGQLEVLQHNISDLKEAIGSVLLPIITPLIEKGNEVVQMFKAWADTNPALMKMIVYLTGATGIAALVTGLTLLASAMTMKLIPAIVATIAALWAKVTATLAAIAATGYGIPIAIAAAAAIGLLATGITLLAQSELAKIDATQKAAEETAKATGVQNQYGASIDNTTDAINKQIKAIKELSGLQRKTIAEAHLAYAKISGERVLTPFEQEQMQILGGMIGIPTMDTGGLVRGPGMFAVGAGVKEVVRDIDSGYGIANLSIYLDGDILSQKLGIRLMDEIRLQGAR